MTNNEKAEYDKFQESTQWKMIKLIIGEVFDEKTKALLENLNRPKENTGFYEIKDICEIFRITPQTFHNWKNRGWIIGRKMGKSRFFTKEEVEQAMTNHQITKGKTPDSILLQQTPNCNE